MDRIIFNLLTIRNSAGADPGAIVVDWLEVFYINPLIFAEGLWFLLFFFFKLCYFMHFSSLLFSIALGAKLNMTTMLNVKALCKYVDCFKDPLSDMRTSCFSSIYFTFWTMCASEVYISRAKPIYLEK